MLVEFRVIPMGHHLSEAWRDRFDELLKTSRLVHEHGPTSVCIEGDWPKVMDVIHHCHQAGFAFSPHVLTSITVNELRRETDPAEGTAQDDLGRRFPRKGMDGEC